MSGVGIAAVWAGAVVLISFLFFRQLGRPIAEVFEAWRARTEANSERDRAEALERQNEAQLARDVAPERAEQYKAKLRQETAEADAAAEVAKSTIPARIVEEEQVIAARAEGRAIAAKDRAMNGDGGSSEELQLLLETYERFRANWRNEDVTFSQWLGKLQFADGRLSSRQV
jgi:hypothetical protein